jgi:hypothetical protein
LSASRRDRCFTDGPIGRRLHAFRVGIRHTF